VKHLLLNYFNKGSAFSPLNNKSYLKVMIDSKKD